jgi:ABC-type molybdate transport system substrate-binding protein
MSLRVLSAGVMRRLVGEVGDAFHRETGHAVLMMTGTVGELSARAEAGEPADVFVLTDTAVDALARQGLVVPGSRVDTVRGKAVLWPGGSAAEAVVRGQAELVVHQISEILAVPGVTLVGPMPAALQKVTTYAVGLAARSVALEPARALIAYLARPALKPRLAAAGLDYRE